MAQPAAPIPVNGKLRNPLTGQLRWLLPVMLVLFFLAILLWLPWQARQMENTELQEQLIADTLWVEQTIRLQLGRDEESLRVLGAELDLAPMPQAKLTERLQQLLQNGPELQRVVYADAHGVVRAASSAEPFGSAGTQELSAESAAAARHAQLSKFPQYSQPAPQAGNPHGPPAAMLMDYHLPLFHGQRYVGSLIATYRVTMLLDEMVPWWFARDNQITLLDSDERILARRAAAGPGHGVFTHKRALDLPGASVFLLTDSIKSAPRLLPNLLVGSVIVLSLGLLGSLLALWRHITRRLDAEGALREQMSFRTAMENSLGTGLRARDLAGRVTYVNPAFCAIVGYAPEQLVGRLPPMPYWAPEAMTEYQQRFAGVLAGTIVPQFETIFQHANGARIPVLVFEAPLVDDAGRQTGWMGSILDISDRKRIEDLNRQQQELLQTSARLATMGEMASMLAHELNQPLAAISSYTTGALNLIERAGSAGQVLRIDLLKPALEQASKQAQRAGQIIRSVHEFVKKAEPERHDIALAALVDGIRALIDLQARKFYVAIELDLPADLPPVRADRLMIEQVLLNLTRNAIEAMQGVAPERRLMRLVARHDRAAGQVSLAVIDQGTGIADAVAERLFSPFFSTKAEGMGMGLNICRTALEFHGGTLSHRANPLGGTVFSFALPAVEAANQ